MTKKETARELALKIMYQVNEENAYANLALDKALYQYKEMDPRDKGLVTEIVYGSIKNRGKLDWVINQFANPKIAKMDPWVRNILREGVYQMMFLDKVPVSAAVNEAVELTKHYSHQGGVKFVNGVLRNIEREMGQLVYPNRGKQPVQYLTVCYSFPQWLIERWVKQFGVKKTELMCGYFNEPAPLWIRTNTLKITRSELKARLAEQGIESVESEHTAEGLMLKNTISLHSLDLFQEGYFTVQDESSMLVALAASPKEGQRVLDVCSAPGGKTTHLAQLMHNTGEIVACDIHDHRLDLIDANCKRLGVENVQTKRQDGLYLAEDLDESFDVVLVDAPCSGLGVLGRRPDARWAKRASDIGELAAIQAGILAQAAQVVSEQGTLVYSTCTTTKEENEDIVSNFLAAHQNFQLADDLSACWSGFEKVEQGYAQFLPFEDQMDGFFIAKFRKVAGQDGKK